MTRPANPTIHSIRSALDFTMLPQTWRTHLELLRTEPFQPYIVVAFTLWLVGAIEVIQKTGGQRLDPRFWMSLAVLITLYSGIRIFRLAPLRPRFSSAKVT